MDGLFLIYSDGDNKKDWSQFWHQAMFKLFFTVLTTSVVQGNAAASSVAA